MVAEGGDRARRARRTAGLAWIATALWAGLTWLLLTLPPPPAQELPGWAQLPFLAGLPAIDKLGHAALFLVLALLLDRALAGSGRRSRRESLTWTLAAVAVWGAATELRQAFVPGRTAEGLDLLADVAGALAYAAAAWLSRGWRRR